MQRIVFITDHSHPEVIAEKKRARNLEEINIWSTPEEAGKVIANKCMELVRKQLGIEQ